jgi:hypothetical protein
MKLEGKLEFFDVGGDPKELMAYMVKSEYSSQDEDLRADQPRDPGLMPGMASLTNGDIPSKRKMTETYLEGFYKSTFSADPVSGKAFAADAIISNPPAFAHIHVAEALGLPLLVSFSEPSSFFDDSISSHVPGWSANRANSYALVPYDSLQSSSRQRQAVQCGEGSYKLSQLCSG